MNPNKPTKKFIAKVTEKDFTIVHAWVKHDPTDKSGNESVELTKGTDPPYKIHACGSRETHLLEFKVLDVNPITCSIHGNAKLHNFKDGAYHKHHIMSKGATEKEDFINLEPAAFVKSKEPHEIKDPGCHVPFNGDTFVRPSIINDTIGGNLGLFATNGNGESTGVVPDGNRELSSGDTNPDNNS